MAGQETDTRSRDSSGSNVVAKKPATTTVPDVKKLALWDSQAVSPIMTHKELEPILAKLGFIPGEILPPIPLHGAVSWQTYTYTANSRWMTKLKNQAEEEEEPPTVKLPHPQIDGLHEFTYTVFLDALNFYLDLGDNISSILHVRSTEVHKADVKRGKWIIEESEKGRYMYRRLTTLDSDDDGGSDDYDDDNSDEDYDYSDDEDDDAITRWKTRRTLGSSSSSSTVIVPLKHIITNRKK